MAPVIPFLGDEPAQLRATVRAIAAAGATSVTPLVLHLRPGAPEWFMAWLGRHHPHLVRRYERLYAEAPTRRSGTSAGSRARWHDLAREYGIGPTRAGAPRRIAEPPAEPVRDDPVQLSLI